MKNLAETISQTLRARTLGLGLEGQTPVAPDGKDGGIQLAGLVKYRAQCLAPVPNFLSLSAIYHVTLWTPGHAGPDVGLSE